MIAGILFGCCMIISLFLPEPEQETSVVSMVTDTVVEKTVEIPAIPTDTYIKKTLPPIWTPTGSNFVPSPTWSPMNCIPDLDNYEIGTVTQVVDGDTIHVTIDGADFLLRYIGMDTPENTTEQEVYGQEASDANYQLVMGKQAKLYHDVSETDRYDRLLRYVVVDDVFVNYELVKSGYAVAKRYPPDTACAVQFENAQKGASAASLGIWGVTAAVVLPTNTTAPIIQPTPVTSGCPGGCLAETADCHIKGNINSKGEHIYHTYASSSYSATKIDPSKGERWFCTEAEALAAGWRAPRN